MIYRKQLINWLFLNSQRVYTHFKKKEPWGLSTSSLLEFPKDSFGYHLGIFLNINSFELIPKVERHDAYHVLTGFDTKVEDEIALQYLCFGNGKRTPYLFAVLCLGTIILPDYLKYYLKAYKIGKMSNCFHHFDFQTILTAPFETFRAAIFSKDTLRQLQQLQSIYSEKTLHTNTI